MNESYTYASDCKYKTLIILQDIGDVFKQIRLHVRIYASTI